MVVDKSIYEDAQKDVADLLKNYPNENADEATLFIVDREAMDKLKDIEKLLEMEYSQYHIPVPLGGVKPKRKVKPPVQAFSLATIVKVINPDTPANTYQTFVAESWKQINDDIKVKNSLEAEFVKHKNRVRKFTKAKFAKDNISKDAQADILRRIEAELVEAEKELEYILDNFDSLDVRISSYFERTSYGALRWYVKKKRQTDVNLRKQVPNVLWVEKLSDDEALRIDNELVYYLKYAKRAFGDVFYKKIEEDS